MDKIAEAIIKLIDTGAPLAQYAVILYYIKEIVGQVLTAAVIIGVVAILTHTIRWYVLKMMESDEKMRQHELTRRNT